MTSESEIVGQWIAKGGAVVEDENCKRISWLVQHKFELKGRDSSGWDTLYLDRSDGRFWELLYLNSDQQGGGPPSLRLISKDVARQKYGAAVEG